jgi:hypothetical protein
VPTGSRAMSICVSSPRTRSRGCCAKCIRLPRRPHSAPRRMLIPKASRVSSTSGPPPNSAACAGSGAVGARPR